MADNGIMIREDQFIIHVTVNGVNFPSVYSWASLEGGAVTSDSTYTHPGGLLPGVALGGVAQRGDATVKRQYSTGMHGYVAALEKVVGVGRMSISWWAIDPAATKDNLSGGKSLGGGYQMTGILKEVQVPTMDANATAVGFITLVMTPDLEIKQL